MGEPIEMRDTTPVRPGKTVKLTLDANLQDQAEEVLAEVGETWKPKGATAIVMEPNSGAILALANWPRVNANAPEQAPEDARSNRAISVNYEPGSTFKAFTVAAALEDGKVTPETKFQIPPVLAFADRELRDAERSRLGDDDDERDPQVTPPTSAPCMIARPRAARSRSTPGSDRFGFGKPTGVDLPGEQMARSCR